MTTDVHQRLIDWTAPVGSFNALVERVCDERDITLIAFYGAGRTRQVVRARYEVYWCAANELGLSSGWIAQRMRKDSTTVLYGIREHGKLLAKAAA